MARPHRASETIGKAVQNGQVDAIVAHSIGRVQIDPTQHLMIDRREFNEHDFSGLRLQSLTAIKSRFERCSFRDIRVENACWGAGRSRSDYVECCFDGAEFRSTVPGIARFVRCSFRNIQVHEFLGFNIELIDCIFSGRIDGGFLNATRKREPWSIFGQRTNEIFGNDFSNCDLRDFAFRTGVDLEQQKLPCGPEYVYVADAKLALARARTAIEGWADVELRRLAGVILDTMQYDLAAGQGQQLFRRYQKGQFADPSAKLFDLLADRGA